MKDLEFKVLQNSLKRNKLLYIYMDTVQGLTKTYSKNLKLLFELIEKNNTNEKELCKKITKKFNSFFNNVSHDLLFEIGEKYNFLNDPLEKINNTTSKNFQIIKDEQTKLNNAGKLLCKCIPKLANCDQFVEENEQFVEENEQFVKEGLKNPLLSSTTYIEPRYEEPIASTSLPLEKEKRKYPEVNNQLEIIETIYNPVYDLIERLSKLNRMQLKDLRMSVSTSSKASFENAHEEDESNYFKGVRFKKENSEKIQILKYQVALSMIKIFLEKDDDDDDANMDDNYAYNDDNYDEVPLKEKELLDEITKIMTSLSIYSPTDLTNLKNLLIHALENIDKIDTFLSLILRSKEKFKITETRFEEINKKINEKIKNRQGFKWQNKVYKAQADKEIDELNQLLQLELLKGFFGRNISIEEKSCIAIIGMVDVLMPYEGRELLGGKRKKRRKTKKRPSNKKRRKSRRR